GAQLADDRAQVDVLGLLLEDDERADDVETRLDHRRELAREDLERLWLDLLEDRADGLLAARGQLHDRLREQAAQPQLLARAVRVGGVDLALRLETVRVDSRVGE